MKTWTCRITHLHPWGFRYGQPGTVMGMVFLETEEVSPRPCFLVRWPDGVTDYLPLADVELYAFLPGAE